LRVLFDTNIILDLLLDREPFSKGAGELFSKVEAGEVSGFICATAVTTVYYLASKVVGPTRAKQQVRSLLSLLEVASVNRSVLEASLESEFDDFEDAVVHEAARQVDADAIVTRDVEDFRRASLPTYSCEELLTILRA